MKLVGGFVSITIAIIMIAGVLVPAVSDALPNVGDPITVSNQNFDSYYKEVDDGDVLVVTDTSASFNGEAIGTFTYRGGFYSDLAYLYLNGSVQDGMVGFIIDNTGIGNRFNLTSGRTWTVTYTEDSISVVGTAADLEPLEWSKDGFEWILSISNESNADYFTIEDLRYSSAYVSDPKTQVIYSGYYDSGDNDTFISYRDGKIIQNVNNPYDVSIDFDTTLKDGTTDIYDVKVEITVGDESFVPYIVLVPETIYGHEDGGSAYSALLAIIPLTIVSVLVAAVVLIMRRDNY